MSQMVRLIRSGDSWPPRVWEPLCRPGIPPVKRLHVEVSRYSGWIVGNSYLGITSGLLVIRPESAEGDNATFELPRDKRASPSSDTSLETDFPAREEDWHRDECCLDTR
jgi:hypothetical protein